MQKIEIRSPDADNYGEVLAPVTEAGAVKYSKNGTETSIHNVLNKHIDDYAVNTAHTYFGTAGGTNTKVMSFMSNTDISPIGGGGEGNYKSGLRICFINSSTSTTNPNGFVTFEFRDNGAKPIIKADGTQAKNSDFKEQHVYTIVYNQAAQGGTGAFFLQGEGGEYGTAIANDVVAGKTIGTDNGIVTGTMPNRTGQVTGQSISRSGTTLRIRPQQGHYPADAANSVQWSDPNWVAANVRNGVSVFGLTGTLANEIKAGNNYHQVNIPYTGRYTINKTPTKLGDRFTVTVSGSVQIRFEVATNDGNIGYARIYKNGTPVGTQRTASGGVIQTFVEDFYCESDDYFELYCWCNNAQSIFTERIVIQTITPPFVLVT